MHLYRSYHNHTNFNIFKSDFWEFEFSVWLHMLGRSLILIFIPILLLNIGYSIEMVIIYYLIYTFFDIPLNLVAKNLIIRWGAKIVIIIANLFSVTYFLMLFFLSNDNLILFLSLALMAALYDSFYWVSLRYIFMQIRNKKESSSRTTSIFYIVQKLSGALGPIIGAALLIFESQYILIIASITISILSIIPLLKIKNINKKTCPNINFKKFFQQKQIKKNYISVALFNMHLAAEDIIWPLFIFIAIGTIESIATLSVVVSISTIIFMYFIGHLKKQAPNKMILLGSFLIIGVWIVRLLYNEPIFYYVSVSLMGFFAILISLPLDAQMFKYGEKTDALSASTYENGLGMAFKFLFFLILAIAVNIFKVGFITAATVMFTLIIITYSYQLLEKKQSI